MRWPWTRPHGITESEPTTLPPMSAVTFRAALGVIMRSASHLPPEEVLDALSEQAEVCRGEMLRRTLRAVEDAHGVEPHIYMPSASHMGDCAICGHLQNSPIHIRQTDGA